MKQAHNKLKSQCIILEISHMLKYSELHLPINQ